MTEKFRVRFRRHWSSHATGGYNGGEVAGFPAHIAQALCAGDDPVAELVDKPTEAAPAKSVVSDTSRASAKKSATSKRKRSSKPSRSEG